MTDDDDDDDDDHDDNDDHNNNDKELYNQAVVTGRHSTLDFTSCRRLSTFPVSLHMLREVGTSWPAPRPPARLQTRPLARIIRACTHTCKHARTHACMHVTAAPVPKKTAVVSDEAVAASLCSANLVYAGVMCSHK